MIECGDQLRESHSFTHRRKSLPKSTLRRTFLNRSETMLESQLVVGDREVTGGSTPKATLLELCLFRRFVARCLLTESYGKGVASGLTETEKDSKFVSRRQSLKPSHHGAHDAHHVADQPGP